MCTCARCPNPCSTASTSLDADIHAKDGVVRDTRNNFVGMVDSWTLDTLARQSHDRFTARQLPTAPGRLAVGRQTLEKPTILVTNKHILSNGEVPTEGHCALKFGQVVGEPGASGMGETAGLAQLAAAVKVLQAR
jgi:hypothetical protein